MRKVDTRQINYAGYVPTYDSSRFEGKQNQYLERVRTRGVLEVIGRHNYKRRILDVGCGTARGLIELGRAGFTNLTGLDFTAEMLRTGQFRIQRDLGRSVPLIRGDAFRLPFADGSFELVTSFNFLHMFRYELQAEIIRELARVCVRNGQVAVEFESAHKGFFFTRYLEQRKFADRTKFNTMAEVHRLFDANTFSDMRVVGTALPKAYVLFQHAQRLGEIVESIAYVPPFNWMASRVVVGAHVR